MSAAARSLSRNRPSGRKALLATAMLLVAVASAFPLAWMVLSSLKTPAETMQVPPVWIPRTPTLEAYEKVAGVINVGRSMWNSLVIASVTTAGILVTSMMAGYAFAKYSFPGRSLLFSVLLATMFLPPIVTLIPLYRMVGSLGLSASLAGIIVPNLANAFGIFLMRQFIAGVPDDLIDAARMDGASELLILYKIVAPSVAPAIAALALFAFVY
ncbi:MAG: carbohydrate ABC transporter permease, partial [Mesorhizobium sp.]